MQTARIYWVQNARIYWVQTASIYWGADCKDILGADCKHILGFQTASIYWGADCKHIMGYRLQAYTGVLTASIYWVQTASIYWGADCKHILGSRLQAYTGVQTASIYWVQTASIYWGADMQAYTGCRMQAYTGSRLQAYTGCRLQAYTGCRLQAYTGVHNASIYWGADCKHILGADCKHILGADCKHILGLQAFTGVQTASIYWGADCKHILVFRLQAYTGVQTASIYWGADCKHILGCSLQAYTGVQTASIYWGADCKHILGYRLQAYTGIQAASIYWDADCKLYTGMQTASIYCGADCKHILGCRLQAYTGVQTTSIYWDADCKHILDTDCKHILGCRVQAFTGVQTASIYWGADCKHLIEVLSPPFEQSFAASFEQVYSSATSREVGYSGVGLKLPDNIAYSGHRNITISGDGLVALRLSMSMLGNNLVYLQLTIDIELKRHSPFHFTAEPADTIALHGEPAELNCSVHSESAVRLEWKKDGTLLNLDGDGHRSLLRDGALHFSRILHSKNPEPDEGLYQCVITLAGVGIAVSRTARLVVAEPPHITMHTAAVEVSQGNGVLLHCEVHGKPAPHLSWQKDGELLPTDPRVTMLPEGALEISGARASDAGKYRCVAENVAGTRTSKEAKLTVISDSSTYERPAFIRRPVDVAVLAGHTALIECSAIGHPRPKLQWTKRGNIVPGREKRIMMVGGGHLRIDNTTTNDSGIYKCAVHGMNETLEAKAELNVLSPPHFLRRPRNMWAREGADLDLPCDVAGNPAPSVTWVKNGDVVIPSDYFQIVDQHNLRILGLVKSDEGIYQCIAENSVGNSQSSAQLLIMDRAGGQELADGPVPSMPRDLVATLVSTRFIRLRWRAPAEQHGNALTYAVSYVNDGGHRQRVVNTSKSGELRVTVESLQPETEYSFRVVAFNEHGPGQISPALRVATQPEVQLPGPAQDLHAEANSPTSLLVKWKPPLSTRSTILGYRLYYMQRTPGADGEKEVDLSSPMYEMTGLKSHTEYGIRVVALNRHGLGVSSEDVVVRTLSDVPSAPPHNVSTEVQNSRTIILHWVPPLPEKQNGRIIGYRIRYRRRGRREDVESTEGQQLWHQITGLERGTQYLFRVTAMTVNGTGPFSDPVTAVTFEDDLDESRVPEQPSSLHVRPLTNSIVVSWTPPAEPDLLVRGYLIGYGVGSPYTETVQVDGRQRYYTIEKLESNSQYVISLRAFNNLGQGVPLYESATTRSTSDPADPSEEDLFVLYPDPFTAAPDPLSPMFPPVGVQATVLSTDAIKVTWADNSLAKGHHPGDARIYTVRWKTYFSTNVKYKMANTTALSFLVDGLKPSTFYEFSVMVTKGRTSSTWSMTAQVTTKEAVPSSPPKDLTVISKEGKARTVIVNWQPPSEANGKITGYIVYYTTNKAAEMHDWIVEPVVGDRLSHQIHDLTLSTQYHFKVQARNAKGMGPISDPVSFRTPKDAPTGQITTPKGARASPLESNLLVILIVTIGGVIVIGVIVIAIVCTRRSSDTQKKSRGAHKSPSSSNKRKCNPKELNPPDLWIHHEAVALKPISQSPGGPNGNSVETPVTPAAPSIESYGNHRRDSFSGEMEGSIGTIDRSLTTRHAIRGKVTIPADSQSLLAHSRGHFPAQKPPNHYPTLPSSMAPSRAFPPSRTSSRLSRCGGGRYMTCPSPRHCSKDSAHTANNTEAMSSGSSREPESSGTGGSIDEESSRLVVTSLGRPSQPLKSFAVPIVSAHPGPTGDNSVGSSSPALSHTAASQLNPTKTASLGTLGRNRAPVPVSMPSAPATSEGGHPVDETNISSPHEDDELSAEMASLEGLMKDLNAITSSGIGI
uniref:LOW QUALITY PROTEIN: neogenin-like n=1 Tax=Myxine glutinosa TaxID=7769 RepID=UPI00358DFF02